MITLPGNPYNIIGAQHTAGLTSIEAGLTSGMSVNDLAALVYNYVQVTYSLCGDPLSNAEFSAIVPNAAYAYINKEMGGFTANQYAFINLLMKGIFGVPVNSIDSFILDVQDNIFKSCNHLSFEERVPLAIATAVALADYNYWVAAVASPGNWLSKGYFNSNAYVNYASIPAWVSASIQATLWGGSKAKNYGQLDPPQVIGVDLISALTSSLGVAAGKVLFNWIPTIQNC